MKKEPTHTIIIVYDDGYQESYDVFTTEEHVIGLQENFKKCYNEKLGLGTISIHGIHLIPYSKIRRLTIKKIED